PNLTEMRELPAMAAGEGALFAAGGIGAGSPVSFESVTPGPGLAWSIDVPSVATVTAAGGVTALAGGTAHVIASSGDVSGAALLLASGDTLPPATTIAFSTPSFLAPGVIAIATRS